MQSRALWILMIAAAIPAGAQFLNITDNNATPVAGRGHDYIHLGGATLNPATGALAFSLDIPIAPARGFTLPFAIQYQSDIWTLTAAGWEPAGSTFTPPNTLVASPVWSGGWTYSVPQASAMADSYVSGTGDQRVQCDWDSDYVFVAPDGGRHSLPISPSGNSVPEQTCNGWPSVLTGRDGPWVATVPPLGGAGPALTVTSVDGLKFTFPQLTLGGAVNVPASATDRNGNSESISWTGNGAFTYTDTNGRTTLSASGFGATNDTVESLATGSYTLTWGTASSNYSVALTGLTPNCPTLGSRQVVGSQNVIKAITLPNGDQYTFDYDSTYGTLSQITFPGGGKIIYGWGLNPQSQLQSFAYYPNGQGGASQSCAYIADTPAVTTRIVRFDGSTTAQEQDFTYSTTWSASIPSEWTDKATKDVVTDNVAGPRPRWTDRTSR